MNGLIRVFWTLVVHLIVFLILFGLIYFVSTGQDAVAGTLRDQYQDNPDTLETIRSAAVSTVVRGCGLALAVSWIMSSLWLLIAERQRPSSPVEGAAMKPAWVIFLVLALIGYGIMTWWVVLRSTAPLDLAPWMFNTGLISTVFGAILAYYFGTAISVKTVMRPSVPLSGLVPNLGGRS